MSPILGIWASQISGHLWAPEGAYDALATITVGSTSVSSVEFVGIPSGYKHLQIRGIGISAGSGSFSASMQVGNGSLDTSANYSYHLIRGDGSSVSATGGANTTEFYIGSGAIATNVATGFIADILDYANVNKYKTLRSLGGSDANGSGYVGLFSGNWRSLSAITNIKIASNTGNLTQYSQFALYGVK